MAQSANDPVWGPCRRAHGVRRLGALRHREMEQTCGGRERRTTSCLGEAGDALRAPEANLLVEDQAGEFAGAMQLTGSPGQHHAPSGNLVEPARFEPIAHEFEGLFDARRDDTDE